MQMADGRKRTRGKFASTALAAFILCCTASAIAQDSPPAQVESDDFEAAHGKLLRSGDIQLEMTPRIPEEPPPRRIKQNGFWRTLGDFFSALAPLFKILLWAGVPILAIIILAAILRESTGFRFGRRKPSQKTGAVEIGYRPDETHALTLLDDADALAAEGRFEAAARLLLSRSIQDIESRKDVRIAKALTAREISRLETIPENARPAFSQIASIVERSVFAEQALTQAGFMEARNAYQRFALPETWR